MDESLEVLREIRDSQRQLLELTQAWKEQSDRLNQEWQHDWQMQSANAKAINERWEEANKLYMAQYQRWPGTGVLVFAFVRSFVAIGGALLGAIVVLRWLQ